MKNYLPVATWNEKQLSQHAVPIAYNLEETAVVTFEGL